MNQISMNSRILVGIQITGMAMTIWPGHFQWYPGIFVVILGGFLGLWVISFNKPGNFSIFPEPVTEGQLITSGPYKWVRHPMYSSLILLMLGIAFINANWINAMGVLFVLIAVSNKIPREEVFLREKYKNYPDYCRSTKKLIPGIW